MYVQPIHLNAAVHATAAVDPAASSQAATQRFAAIMASGPTAAPIDPASTQHNPVAAIAHAQDAAIRAVGNDAIWLSNNVSNMPIERVFAANMLVQVETATLAVDMQVKMATITASKDAVSTLMKNQ